MRTVRRTISLLNTGLFPVAAQQHSTGSRATVELPRRRSCQMRLVRAEARALASSLARTLSRKTRRGPVRSTAVTRLRISLGSEDSVSGSLTAPGGDGGDQFDQQRRPGARLRFLKQMQRGRPIDQLATDQAQGQGDGVTQLRRPSEGKIRQQLTFYHVLAVAISSSVGLAGIGGITSPPVGA